MTLLSEMVYHLCTICVPFVDIVYSLCPSTQPLGCCVLTYCVLKNVGVLFRLYTKASWFPDGRDDHQERVLVLLYRVLRY